MFKIAIVGAGSIGFTREIVKDLLSVPEFQSITIALTDISEPNLKMAKQLLEKDLKFNGLDTHIYTTSDRREAFQDAKYIFNFVRVGMLDAFEMDIDIPMSYGVDQCVGDTLGPGGIMYGQRGIPVILDFCRDIKEVAHQDCILLNYSNPNAMITWAANLYGGVQTLGLCHGVQNGQKLIAEAFGLDYHDLDVVCVGINHQTWYTSIKHNGQELADQLLEKLEKNEKFAREEKVRIDMMKRFGYFSTESNGHLSEYLPWYRKRHNEILSWIDLSQWIHGESGGYLRHCKERRNWFETEFPEWLNGPANRYGSEFRGIEHGSHIIEALETGRVYRGHFNVVNNGVINNLPDDAIVEVPAYVDQTGINVPVYGDLPLGCAAVCNLSVQVQRLSVQAALDGDEMKLKQAMMLDPLTGTVLNPQEIWQMTDDMLIAQASWLPQYQKVINKARTRQKVEKRIPVSDYSGAARLKTKSIEELKNDQNTMRKFNKAAHDN
jgi:alpha-galactosidase